MSFKKCPNCNNKIDEDSLFCSFCGAKQEIKKKEKISPDTGNKTFDLLSQFGYIGGENSSIKIVKDENNNTDKNKDNNSDNDNLNIDTNNNINSNYNSQNKNNIPQDNIQKDNNLEKESLNIDKNNKNTSFETSFIDDKKENNTNKQNTDNASPFEGNSSNVENFSVASDESSEDFVLPEGFFDYNNNEKDHVFGEDIFEEQTITQKEVSNKIYGEEKEPDFNKETDDKVKNILKNTKKKSYSEKDESEISEFNTNKNVSVNENKNNFIEESKYADEKIDSEKNIGKVENLEEDEEEKEEIVDYSQLEGRKAPPGGSKRRESKRRAEINKKVYNISQDLSDLDAADLDYDGYYENVLPVDFGKNKKKIDVKKFFVITSSVIGILILFVIMIKVVFKYFM